MNHTPTTNSHHSNEKMSKKGSKLKVPNALAALLHLEKTVYFDFHPKLLLSMLDFSCFIKIKELNVVQNCCKHLKCNILS